MAKPKKDMVGKLIRSVGLSTTQTDRELLDRFVDGDESAFDVLVHRHSGMVLGVCCRILPTVQDAEDVCQATFLVLARKAKTGRWQSSIANWLYTTAWQIATKANRAMARRKKREAHLEQPDVASPLDQMTGREAFAVLDEELAKLPARYREPLVLCYLEGLTRDEASVRLGLPTATVQSQIDRGRKKLGDALIKRGFGFGTSLLAVLGTSAARASSLRLKESIHATVTGTPSATVAQLAQGVAMNGILTQTKLTLLGLLGTITLGLGLASLPPITAETNQNKTQKVEKATKIETNTETTKEWGKQRITGKVLDADGKPVVGATVRRIDQPSRNKGDSIQETVVGKTDAAGQFEAETVPYCMFTATVDGMGIAWSESNLRGQEVTLKLAKLLPIKGRLIDLEGKPIPNAKVEIESLAATHEDDLTGIYNAFRVNPDWASAGFSRWLNGKATGTESATMTDPDGWFQLKTIGTKQVVRLRFIADGIDSSGVTVIADPEFAKRTKSATDAEKVASGFYSHQHKPAVYGPEFTHAAKPEHLLIGTIMDAVTGQPIQGIHVWGTIVPISTATSLSLWAHQVTGISNEKGQFTLKGLPKAVEWDLPFLAKGKNRYLYVRAEGKPYLDAIVVVPDTVDQTPAKVEIKLRPAAVVTGTVTNKVTGKPISAQVIWLPLDTNTALANNEDPATAMYTRRYSNVIPSGIYRETDDQGQFHLQVPPGPGVLLGKPSQAKPSDLFTSIRVRKEDQKYLMQPNADPNVRVVGPTQGHEEAFSTLGFAYPLRWVNGYTIIDAQVKDKETQAHIQFDPGTTVTLKVVDPDGKPLTGVTMVGHGLYGEFPPTFASSEFPVSGLDAQGNPQQLYLLHKERQLCGAVKVQGKEKGPITVQLQKCASVTGKAIDLEGKPLANAKVTFQMNESLADDLLRQKLFRDAHTTRTDAKGQFTFSHMFPDLEFSLFVSLPGFRSGAALPKQVLLKSGEVKHVGEFQQREPRKQDNE